MGANLADIPARCTSCDTPIPDGRERCPACGKVFGEGNRCPSCHAIAAVRETRRGHYECAACGAPRRRNPGTPLDSDHAHALSRRATRDRILSWVFFPVGGSLATLGAIILGAGQAWLEGGFQGFTNIFGGVVLALGAVGLFFARRAMRSARKLRDAAEQARLLLKVQRARAGITAAEAARDLRLTTGQADARLTEMAKLGQIDLDVDDAGTVRYRVADPDASEALPEEGADVQSACDELERF
jgi:hypothetical protein